MKPAQANWRQAKTIDSSLLDLISRNSVFTRTEFQVNHIGLGPRHLIDNLRNPASNKAIFRAPIKQAQHFSPVGWAERKQNPSYGKTMDVEKSHEIEQTHIQA